jgi:metal-responsive CopG/Arc/MetJ family transcriptional regulator
VPTELVTIIDSISKEKGISRSKFISNMLREKIRDEKNKQIKGAYNRVFSDEKIKNEQLETASWFEGTGDREGQEW